MGCVNLSTIDIKESIFKSKSVPFNPSKLSMACDEKNVMIEGVVRCLKILPIFQIHLL